MDESYLELFKEYVRQVDILCEQLLNGINEKNNINLNTKYDFFKYRNDVHKMEFQINDTCYRLHGRGCEAISKDIYANWEFGYRSKWCGIDPWKVAQTLKVNTGISYDVDKLREICDQSAEKGLMYKKNDLYYFSISEEEKYKPMFPSDFDTLIIEYKGQAISLKRNKLINRFIRKSNFVLKNNTKEYLLKFIKNGTEIFSIYYDDIGYPEAAVKIMSDEIIKKYFN